MAFSWRNVLLWSIVLSCLSTGAVLEEIYSFTNHSQVDDIVNVTAAPASQDGFVPLDQEDTMEDAANGIIYENEPHFTFYHGFTASFSAIVVSELGDKTWFYAIFMATKHSRITVFAGAMGALGLMTVLSVCLGWLGQLIPRAVIHYVSATLFLLFGLKMLHEAWTMSAAEGREQLQRMEEETEAKQRSDVEAGTQGAVKKSAWAIFVSTVFIQVFMMTLLAEMGDRSQLATVILGAKEDIAGVIIGGVLGHALCTGIAVLGGKYVADKISVRIVTVVGGVVFILFALYAFIFNDA